MRGRCGERRRVLLEQLGQLYVLAAAEGGQALLVLVPLWPPQGCRDKSELQGTSPSLITFYVVSRILRWILVLLSFVSVQSALFGSAWTQFLCQCSVNVFLRELVDYGF